MTELDTPDSRIISEMKCDCHDIESYCNCSVFGSCLWRQRKGQGTGCIGVIWDGIKEQEKHGQDGCESFWTAFKDRETRTEWI